MTTNRNNRIIYLLSAVLVAMNIARIIGVPITHDEGITILEYVPDSYWHIITNHHPTANNHILNTIFTKFLTGIFGMGVFVVRMPALMAQIAFLFFSYRTLRHLMQHPLWIFAGFLILNLNPFIFEFWGLCRGYAFSLAFMMGAVYYLCCVMAGARAWYLWVSLALATLAVYSNFALLNFYIALCAVITFCITGISIFKRLLPVGFFSLLLFALIVVPVRKLKDAAQFYYGGDKGFVQDTISSLLKETLFADSNTGMPVLSWFMVIVVLLCGIYWSTQRLRVNDRIANQGLILWLLLVIPAGATVMQNLLIGNLFLIERTALFFIPLFILQLAFTLYHIRKGKAGIITTWLLVVLSAANFIGHFSFVATRSWNYDRHNVLVLERMMKGKQQDKLNVKVYWMFTPSFQYYTAYKYQGKFHPIIHNRTYTTADTTPDYYYIHRDDLPDISSIYTMDTSFMEGKYILLKK